MSDLKDKIRLLEELAYKGGRTAALRELKDRIVASVIRGELPPQYAAIVLGELQAVAVTTIRKDASDKPGTAYPDGALPRQGETQTQGDNEQDGGDSGDAHIP